ncbi:hypothetical protein J6590_092763 [Homalodisca vitripennis]|nr:hypothetical protein J6590_092763 [Homalodisca vitripennis]
MVSDDYYHYRHDHTSVPSQCHTVWYLMTTTTTVMTTPQSSLSVTLPPSVSHCVVSDDYYHYRHDHTSVPSQCHTVWYLMTTTTTVMTTPQSSLSVTLCGI